MLARKPARSGMYPFSFVPTMRSNLTSRVPPSASPPPPRSLGLSTGEAATAKGKGEKTGGVESRRSGGGGCDCKKRVQTTKWGSSRWCDLGGIVDIPPGYAQKLLLLRAYY
ncbi:hypothetical protein NL676_030968 [Syzygium grande]|nr:hypothetical protein NL676_030968 [Syzygium grande]